MTKNSKNNRFMKKDVAWQFVAKWLSSTMLIANKIKRLFLMPYYSYLNKQTDYLNWKQLLKLRFVRTNPFILPENYGYGHISAVRNLGGKIYGSRIEHGVPTSDNFAEFDHLLYTKWKRFRFQLKRIYTFSEVRANTLRKHLQEKNIKTEVIPLGPYILGADYFYSEQKRMELKKKYGRILLAFPQHSIAELRIAFETNEFINHIKRIAVDFDSVFVSLHPYDLSHGGNVPYEKAGFIIVCSGLSSNPLFISRQKDLIALADTVITNSIGTHLGYSIAMGIPCYLVEQKFNIKIVENFSDNRKKMLTEHLKLINEENRFTLFYELFNKYPPKINKEQIELVQKYWGKFESR